MRNMLNPKKKIVISMAAAFVMVLFTAAPMAAFAANNPLRFTVKQDVAPSTLTAEFTYILKPLAQGSPMPEGSTAEGYMFTIAGNKSVEIGPISFSQQGVHRYELLVKDEQKPGYTYDKQVYTIEVYAGYAGYVGEGLAVNVLLLNKEGKKETGIEFTNAYKSTWTPPDEIPDEGGSGGAREPDPRPVVTPPAVVTPPVTTPPNETPPPYEHFVLAQDPLYEYGDPAMPKSSAVITDPPVMKTVFGNPSQSSAFIFKLEAQNPGNPMPYGSAGGVKTIQISGSGQSDFGTWSYFSVGTYFYTISEVNTGEKGYIYDTTVYTITDTVEVEGGQLVFSRIITNEMNKHVTSLDFINTYKPGMEGPKTGDSTNTVYDMIQFALGVGLTAGAIGYLIVGEKKGRGAGGYEKT